MQIDPFTQHPENVGDERVLRQHCQDFAAYLTGSEQGKGGFKTGDFENLTGNKQKKRLLTSLLAFIAWLFATESESHMMVRMEFMMKERNIFLWREILWQLRLLEGASEKERNLWSLVHYSCSKEWVAAATLSETVLTHIWVAHCDKVTPTSNVSKTISIFYF